jgi:hypothetical protein
MGEMIERVARAIFAGADKPPSWLMGRNPDDWDALSPSERAQFEKCARAAIEAMMEPSRAMCAAGWEAATWTIPHEIPTIFEAMITAVLKEADRSGLGVSVAESGGTASPKSDSDRGH